VDKLVVTVSAPHGAGGGIVGPAVAERLGVPFLDRAIPVAVAEALDVPLSEAMARDSRREAGIGRLLASLAVVAVPEGLTHLTPEMTHSEQTFKEQTEIVIRDIAQKTGGVILGRAGAVVLENHPSALHVRLDGEIEARVRQAVQYGEADEGTARKHLQQADRAREAYVQHFYRRDPKAATLYHIVINATKLDLETCTELIVLAARARSGLLGLS
jgi:cytidylate kinase